MIVPRLLADIAPPGPIEVGAAWLIQSVFSVGSLAYIAFQIWMFIECLRKEPDRLLWSIVIWIVPLGPFIFFFLRWLPQSGAKAPSSIKNLTRGSELRQLETAAAQIGNAHQFIQLGDTLRELGKFDRAGEAYAQALAKDPDDIQALWGAALVDIEHKQFDSAEDRLRKVLEQDPQYKFGDVSLALGKTIHAQGRTDEAGDHLEEHINRWRHPEAMYLLANIQIERGQEAEARATLQAMLMDINGSPRAIARKYGAYKSKARKLLRRLPTHTA